jgi:hypothetical protein
VKDRTDTEFGLQRSEHSFNLRQLHIACPQNCRICIGKIRPKQVVAIAQFSVFEFSFSPLKTGMTHV